MKSEGVDAKRLVARHRHNELERRERELRQRQVDIRLREMEADIHGNNTPIHKTVKHQPENSRNSSTTEDDNSPEWAKWAMGLLSLSRGNLAGFAMAGAGFDWKNILLNYFTVIAGV